MYRNLALKSYIYQSCDLKNLQMGDHVCLLYENDDENIILDYVMEGLRLNQKVACIAHSKDQFTILNLLKDHHCKIQNYLDKNQLIFANLDKLLEKKDLNYDVNYQEFIKFYQEILKNSLEEGYSTLRIFNDMNWVINFLDYKEKFIKLEALLTENFYKQSPALGLCGFKKNLFLPSFLNNLLESYQLFYFDNEICPNNYYIPTKISSLEKNDQDLFDYKIVRIKEDKYRERQISHLYKQTEELRDFSNMIAHDLKGPLRRINVINDIIKTEYESVLDKVVRELHEKLSYSLKDMNDRMNGLIELTNLTAQKNFKLQKLDLLILESVQHFKEEFSKIDGDFQLNFVKDLPELSLNRNLILQLFENIFNNSIKFRKKEEKLLINIELHRDDYNYIQVIISDNGVGFNSQFKIHIFKPFQRLHLEQEYEGQGMGLAICFRIMQKHGGSIEAESSEDEGTKIILTFPKP